MEFSIEELRAFNNWKKREKLLDPRSLITYQKLTNESRIYLLKADKNLKVNYSENDLSKLNKYLLETERGKTDHLLDFLIKKTPTNQITGPCNNSISPTQFFNNPNNTTSNNFFNKPPVTSTSGGTTWGSSTNGGFQVPNTNIPLGSSQNSINGYSNNTNTPFMNNPVQGNSSNNIQSSWNINVNPTSNSISNNNQNNQAEWSKPPKETINNVTNNSLSTKSISIINKGENYVGDNNKSAIFNNVSLQTTSPLTSTNTQLGQSCNFVSNNSNPNSKLNSFPSSQTEFAPSASFFQNPNQASSGDIISNKHQLVGSINSSYGLNGINNKLYSKH